MSGRHQPIAGADSEYVLSRFRVVMADDDGGRHNVIIRAAIGPNDAKGQARELFPYDYPLSVEEVAADFADAEENRAREMAL